MPQRDPILRFLTISFLIIFIGGWTAFFSGNRASISGRQETFAQERVLAYGPEYPGDGEECPTGKVPVLMYHHIRHCPTGSGCGTKGSIEYGLSVDPTLFERQMQTLKERGYYSVLPRELTMGNIPCKAFVLTFDDGYDDNKEVLPVLAKYGFRAGFAIIIDRVDRAGYMGASDIVKLKEGGHEILSHSVSHPSLVSLPDAKLTEELVRSRNALGSAFGVTVQGLVYPSGKYDARVERATRRAGYRMAFTTVGGWADPGKDTYSLRRLRMSNTMNAELEDVLR